MATKKYNVLPKAAGAMALALMLAACSGDGDSRSELRKLAGVEIPSAATPLPSPTLQPESTEPPQIIPTPVYVEVTQPAQVVVVTQVFVVTSTPAPTSTPDIAGFQDAGIDESIQPCPVRYWKRGRCIATQAQIDAASEATR